MVGVTSSVRGLGLRALFSLREQLSSRLEQRSNYDLYDNYTKLLTRDHKAGGPRIECACD
jgi:hypothetical protein